MYQVERPARMCADKILTSSNQRNALRTARSDRQVRSAMRATDGQQAPSSLALSAREINTDFCAGLMPWSGQHAVMTIVLTQHLSTTWPDAPDFANCRKLTYLLSCCLHRVRCA
ncbi:hypothetical protein D3C77_611320 [compost metagenome]